MPLAFSVTWDYRCPFARNVHEHVVTALEAGADWDVTFVPFSLGQVHVAEGETDIWERPADDSGLTALQAGVVVRDRDPEHFLAAHRALFSLRHDQAGRLDDADQIAAALRSAGVDADEVLSTVASGSALDTVRKEHEAAASQHDVWGVPTFIAGDRAVFARLMDRPGDDAGHARRSIERIVDLVTGWPELNELKATSIPR
ncbi:MAG: DsbA family protein [Acidimicrobiia bacterium]